MAAIFFLTFVIFFFKGLYDVVQGYTVELPTKRR
jgi:hypothetical protein